MPDICCFLAMYKENGDQYGNYLYSVYYIYVLLAKEPNFLSLAN